MTNPVELRRAAALRALDFVEDGMALGLGTGRTAELFVVELAQRVEAGLKVVGVPTSVRVEQLAWRLGVPLTTLGKHPRLDLTVDGADEIDLRTFNLLKGRGGALLREKIVACATAQEVIVADESKLVARLGERAPVPVETVRFGWRRTASSLEGLGCRAELRQAGGAPFVTDEGHYVLDCHFGPLADPAGLAARIKALTGVVEHGIFIGLAWRAVVAGEDGVTVYEAGRLTPSPLGEGRGEGT